jgi:hypothetical protein
MQLSEKLHLLFTIRATEVAEEVVMEGEEEAGAGLAPMLGLAHNNLAIHSMVDRGFKVTLEIVRMTE